MSRIINTRHARWLIVAVLSVVVAFVIENLWYGWRTRPDEESMAFARLSTSAQEMIKKRVEGVEDSNSRAFISSFQDFGRYVADTRPEWVRGHSDRNPFPGVLPRGSYIALSGSATRPSDPLLMSTRVYRWSTGAKYRIGLTCNGDVVKPDVRQE